MEDKFIGLGVLVQMLCDRLTNRFDGFVVIEGKRGLGKSTLGFKILRAIHREMKKRGVDGYKFFPKKHILYQRKEVLKFLHRRQSSALADELITSAFNRDFYNEDQKDLIKMLNMNRDHNNCLISCIPSFKVLDSQIKNLCCMKITVIRRGVAIIHTPNKTIYSPDIWDERFNEKIERGWLTKNVKNPHYSKLTTFRKFIRFSKLSPKQEELYQKIKDDKRNILAKDKGLEEMDEKDDPFLKIYNALINGKIKNTAMLDGMIMINGTSEIHTKNKLRRKIKADGKANRISDLYLEVKKTVPNIIKERKRSELNALIDKVKGRV